MEPTTYPIQFSVDYPNRPLDWVSTFFRLFAAIPILIVLAAISGATWQLSVPDRASAAGADGRLLVIGAGGGLLFFAPLLMILVRQKYPRWWFDWNRELLRFTNRVAAYLALMDDRYPSTDEQQAVHLDIPYPDAARELNRWLPLVKWLLAIPHYLVLLVLALAAVLAVIGAWIAILVAGRYPRGLFDFVEGVLRWNNRVVGYAFLLVTDQYPPFRLAP
jgi:hypothetical protein